MTGIAGWLNQHNVSLFSVGMTVAFIIAAAIVIFVLSRLVQRWLTHLQSRIHLTDETTRFIAQATTAALWATAALLILDIWGVSLGGVWTLLVSTITLVGVGFLATWTMISNFTASLFLTLWRPFHLGQTVEILPENLKGRVTDRNLMFTMLREESGSSLQVPNNIFFQKLFRVSGEPTVSWRDKVVHSPSLVQQ